ncbi:hypothetical protein RintRC_6747 [Richelia intracellularis]|nr:hypothetical protein RintRC_6747 [Richelia intracellularis]
MKTFKYKPHYLIDLMNLHTFYKFGYSDRYFDISVFRLKC